MRSKIKTFLSIICFNWGITKLPYMPNIISIEITNNCNYQCIFCPMNIENDSIIKKVDRPKTDMNFKDFKYVVDKYGKFIDLVNLSFHGEPFCNKNFDKMVKYLSKKKIKYSIVTNGSLLNEQKSFLLFKYPPNDIRFSLYTLNNDKYSELTTNGKLDRTLENIDFFMKHRNVNTRVGFRTINMDYLKGEKSNFIKKFSKYKNTEFIFGVLNSWAGRVDISKYDSKILKKHSVKNHYCLQPWITVNVGSDLGVYICNNHDETPVGNLKEESLKDIWNGKKYIEIRKNILENKMEKNQICKNCSTFNPFSNMSKPTILFFLNKGFIRIFKGVLGLNKNRDWTKEEK